MTETDRELLDSCLNQAAKLVKGALKIDMEPKQRLALKAALRYLVKAGAKEEAPRNGRRRGSSRP